MCHVLIIEDEGLTSEGLVAALEAKGLECDVASDLGQAIQSLRSRSYSAVLVDLMLPEGVFTTPQPMPDTAGEHLGVHLMRRIRSGEFGAAGNKENTPVFVLTAVVERAAWEAVSSLHPEQVFVKPETPTYIADHIKLCIEG